MTSPVTNPNTEITLPIGGSDLVVASLFKSEEVKTEAFEHNMKGLEGVISKIADHIRELKKRCEEKQRSITALQAEEYQLDCDRQSAARKVQSYAVGAEHSIVSLTRDNNALSELKVSSNALKNRAEKLYRDASTR